MLPAGPTDPTVNSLTGSCVVRPKNKGGKKYPSTRSTRDPKHESQCGSVDATTIDVEQTHRTADLLLDMPTILSEMKGHGSFPSLKLESQLESAASLLT